MVDARPAALRPAAMRTHAARVTSGSKLGPASDPRRETLCRSCNRIRISGRSSVSFHARRRDAREEGAEGLTLATRRIVARPRMAAQPATARRLTRAEPASLDGSDRWAQVGAATVD